MSDALHIKGLYNRPAFRAYLVDCPGHVNDTKDEEMSWANEYVFPLKGLFVRRSRQSTDVADQTSVLFFRKGQPFCVDHPECGRDASLVIQDLRGEPGPCFGRDAPGSQRLATHDWTRVRALAAAANARADGRDFFVEEQLELLIGSVLADFRRERPAAKSRQGPLEGVRRDIVKKAVLYLHRACGEQVSVTDVASAAGSSPNRLCRLFKERTGYTLHQYLMRLRLRRSLELLQADTAALTEIAIDTGFSSHSHFGALFKKAFGVTPSAYRIAQRSKIY